MEKKGRKKKKKLLGRKKLRFVDQRGGKIKTRCKKAKGWGGTENEERHIIETRETEKVAH